MDPVVLGPGEGERAGSSASASCVIKAVLDQMTLVEFMWPAASAGPQFHVHHKHADGFYVLGGRLTMTVGPDRDELRLDRGDFVLVPPDVAHTFRNDESTMAHFLNIHAPDTGYAESLRGRREGFDQYPAPDDGGLPVSGVVIRRAGSGDVKATLEDGMGSLALTEVTAPAGPAEPHDADTGQVLFVLDGPLELRIGDRSHELDTGASALISPGTAHATSSAGDEPVRFLRLSAPA